MKVEPWLLAARQELPLSIKIEMSENRIRSWYKHFKGKVYVSFSGGKDSTVLLDLVRNIYSDVVAVFVDTGLEYPEIRDFVKTIDNVIWLKPKMNFKKVIEKYGYPVVSKENAQKIDEIKNTKSNRLRQKRLYGDEKGNGKLSEKWKFLIEAPFKISDKCCNVMKKRPIYKYEKETNQKPFIGTMAIDSSSRNTSYLRKGCNSFDSKRPVSNPLSFWLESDIWEYLTVNKVPYSEIYDKGIDRTGCMFCMFGIHMEKGKNRFQQMKKLHPKQYNYCIYKLGCGEVLNFIDIDYGEDPLFL